jgi:hypothetical protein
LNYPKLKKVLDFFSENEPKYLTCILVKNQKGQYPLKIAIENDSPKNASLMIEKLISFGKEY